MVAATRRALMIGGVVLAAPGAHAAPASNIAEVWRQARRLDVELRTAFPDDPEPLHLLDRLWSLEDVVLAGPIRTPADCMAKLAAVGLSVTRGERCDGSDERAYADAIRWMEAH